MRSHTFIRRRDAMGLIAGAAATLGAPALRAAEPRRVRYVLSIPTMSAIVSNQTSIPRLLGYYEEEGVSVEPVLAGAAGISGAMQLVTTGDQDIGSGSYTPLMTRAAEGQDMGLSFFYLQARSYALDVAVHADGPLKTMQDLKGKLIGVPTLANEGVPASRFLARDAGMNADTDIRFIAIGGGAQAAQALRSRQVDAYAAPRSQIVQVATLGLQLRSLPLPAKMRDLFGVGLYARRDFLQKNRATAVGVGRAVAKSTIFMMTNPEAAIRLHWKAFPEQMPQGMPVEQALENGLKTLRAQMETIRFQDHESVRQYGQYRPEAIAAMLEVFGWAGKVQNPNSFFTNDLIAEINAFDREKIVQQARSYKVT